MGLGCSSTHPTSSHPTHRHRLVSLHYTFPIDSTTYNIISYKWLVWRKVYYCTCAIMSYPSYFSPLTVCWPVRDRFTVVRFLESSCHGLVHYIYKGTWVVWLTLCYLQISCSSWATLSLKSNWKEILMVKVFYSSITNVIFWKYSLVLKINMMKI